MESKTLWMILGWWLFVAIIGGGAWGWVRHQSRKADDDEVDWSPPHVDREVYALAGEEVTCENGHVICEFKTTVYRDAAQDLPTQLHHWRQREPKVGDPMPFCMKCGARWYDGASFHFRGGWRA